MSEFDSVGFPHLLRVGFTQITLIQSAQIRRWLTYRYVSAYLRSLICVNLRELSSYDLNLTATV